MVPCQSLPVARGTLGNCGERIHRVDAVLQRRQVVPGRPPLPKKANYGRRLCLSSTAVAGFQKCTGKRMKRPRSQDLLSPGHKAQYFPVQAARDSSQEPSRSLDGEPLPGLEQAPSCARVPGQPPLLTKVRKTPPARRRSLSPRRGAGDRSLFRDVPAPTRSFRASPVQRANEARAALSEARAAMQSVGHRGPGAFEINAEARAAGWALSHRPPLREIPTFEESRKDLRPKPSSRERPPSPPLDGEDEDEDPSPMMPCRQICRCCGTDNQSP